MSSVSKSISKAQSAYASSDEYSDDFTENQDNKSDDLDFASIASLARSTTSAKTAKTNFSTDSIETNVVTNPLAAWDPWNIYNKTERAAKGDLTHTEPEYRERWQLEIRTGDVKHAGTRAVVHIDIYGTRDSLFDTVINPDSQKFARNSSMKIIFNTNVDLGRLQKIRVWHDDTGSSSSWFLSSVVVRHIFGSMNAVIVQQANATLASSIDEYYEFKCEKWLSNEYDDLEIIREVPATGPFVETPLKICQYVVKVFTGSDREGGTDANVHIKMYGKLGDSGNRTLAKSQTHKDKFEPGHMDEFVLNIVDLGEIVKIKIGHDGAKSLRRKLTNVGGAGWFLDKVIVVSPMTNPEELPRITTFPCERWLHKGKDDGKIERELLALTQDKPKETQAFTIVTFTSHMEAALAAPPFPEVILHGENGSTPRLVLDKPNQNGVVAFGSKQRDEFTRTADTIGPLEAITVWFESKEPPISTKTVTAVATPQYSSGQQSFTPTTILQTKITKGSDAKQDERNIKVYTLPLRKIIVKTKCKDFGGEMIELTYTCKCDELLGGEGHDTNVRMSLIQHDENQLKSLDGTAFSLNKSHSRRTGFITSTGLYMTTTTNEVALATKLRNTKLDNTNTEYEKLLATRKMVNKSTTNSNIADNKSSVGLETHETTQNKTSNATSFNNYVVRKTKQLRLEKAKREEEARLKQEKRDARRNRFKIAGLSIEVSSDNPITLAYRSNDLVGSEQHKILKEVVQKKPISPKRALASIKTIFTHKKQTPTAATVRFLEILEVAPRDMYSTFLSEVTSSTAWSTWKAKSDCGSPGINTMLSSGSNTTHPIRNETNPHNVSVVEERRERLNDQAYQKWLNNKNVSKQKSKQQQENKRRREAAEARRINDSLRSTVHYCPVPRGGGVVGGEMYVTQQGSDGWVPSDRGVPHRDQRWLYGGRSVAGKQDADSWEF